MTYGDKYDKRRYSIFRFYREIRRKAPVTVLIGRLYPNVLDHIVLDDDDVDAELIKQITRSPYVDDAAASIQRFASRCFAADKSEMMMKTMSQVLNSSSWSPNSILDVLLFYGAKLDPNDFHYFKSVCRFEVNDVIVQWLENGHHVTDPYDVKCAIESGNCDTIKLVFGAYRRSIGLGYISLFNATVQSFELCLSLNIIQRGKHYEFSNVPSFSVLQWILDHDVMEHDEILIDIARSASRYNGHYFDMFRYLIEQRNFTVPRDILTKLYLKHTTDLDVFDYLLLHGADVNAVDKYGHNVLRRSPMLVRYWMDKGLVVKSDDGKTLVQCIYHDMTVAVLEMMIDKYSMDVNADRHHGDGDTVLHHACHLNRFEIVEMLIKHGADVNKHDSNEQTPYDVTSDDRIKRLLISHGYKPHV